MAKILFGLITGLVFGWFAVRAVEAPRVFVSGDPEKGSYRYHTYAKRQSMLQDHRFHGCSHYDFRNYLPHDHYLGKLDHQPYPLVQIEIRLDGELGMDKRSVERFGTDTLSMCPAAKGEGWVADC